MFVLHRTAVLFLAVTCAHCGDGYLRTSPTRQLYAIQTRILNGIQELYNRLKQTLNTTLESLRTLSLERIDMDSAISWLLKSLGVDTQRMSRLTSHAMNSLSDWINATFMVHRSTMGSGRSFNQHTLLHQPEQLVSAVWAWLIDGQLRTPLTQLVTAASDRQLPGQLIQQLGSEHSSGDNQCLQLAVCAAAPLVWAAQTAVQQAVSRGDTQLVATARAALPSYTNYRVYGEHCFTEYSGCLMKRQ